MKNEILSLLNDNYHIIVISAFGGIVLFGLKIAEHFNRPIETKFGLGRYVFFVVCLLICLPALGGPSHQST